MEKGSNQQDNRAQGGALSIGSGKVHAFYRGSWLDSCVAGHDDIGQE